MNVEMVDLLIDPIGELATSQIGSGPARGAEMQKVSRIKNAAIAVRNGQIVAAGPANDVRARALVGPHTVQVDATDKLVTPGLIDPHTHLIFGGNRANEFGMRCQGRSYAEIANAGGGIVASMRATRQASLEQLVRTGLQRLSRMLRTGTTTCEVKTGYGLDIDSELRMLQAILNLDKIQPIDLIPTFMPAHAFPPDVPREEYVRSVVDDMLPRAWALIKEANDGQPAFNDVFCDQGYFTLQQTETILNAGKNIGFQPRVHSDEFASLGATALAAKIGAASADHLLNISDDDINRLAASDTVAVLLPGTSFFLNLPEHAPARRLIDQGAAVALGTDFNPGSCHIFSLPFIWGLACLHLKMTNEEVLTALTVNSAYSLRVGDRVGRIEPGMTADLVIYEVSSLEEIPYNIGWNPVSRVFKNGKLVFDNQSVP